MIEISPDFIVCTDQDGKYCFPKAYKPSVPNILFGNPAEELTKAVMAEHCSGGGIFHAGAYVGDFFPAISKMLDPGAVCVSCEPTPLSYAAAQGTIRLNGIQNIELHPVALGSSVGQIEMQTHDSAGRVLAQTTRVNRGDKTAESVKVATDTIDRLGRHANIKTLHLDLEGYEVHALAGATETLARPDVIVIIENYQKKLIQDFLSDFTCFGEADGNYFFSRAPVTGVYTEIARARLLEKQESVEEALRAVEAVYAAHKDLPLVAEEFMQMLQRRGDFERSLELALRLVDRDPVRLSSYAAIEGARRAGLSIPNVVDLLHLGMVRTRYPNCAYFYLTAGLIAGMDLEAAKSIADSYVEEYPVHPEMLLIASKVYEARGEFAPAVDVMGRASGLRPKATHFAERHQFLKDKLAAAQV